MIRKFIKRLVKPLFQFFGLEVTSAESKPKPPPIYDDLEKVLTLNRVGIRASYECPIDQCVILSGFSFAETGWHPFVEAYRDINARSGKPRYPGSFLEKYYSTWTPENSADAVAGFANAPAALKSIAPFTLHAPWMDARPLDRQALMERIIVDENTAAGCPELDAREGYGLHGPVSEKKGEIEFQRLVKIYESIKAFGYDRTQGEGDVTVIGIEYNEEFRFCVMHGQHRAAAVAALGLKTVPVSITKVVHYTEISHWPQVYRGYWSQIQAQKFIEHLFTFDSRIWAREKGLIL
ncbi:hypothetical protein GCM10011533_25700 [Streptosporangium jomthongense]|uniref:Uncharacterized protein n=1 Tax=Marinobacter aromaticivorans TaxID=1494078 RepID=A0ABW2IXS9_9GAMM|nr:hypothetical protein [Marinobacter aromaticivorans]GGE72242.1 hypothetical protein GCM10011533_25700 [Streptosporangium jomthongense]